MTDVRERLARIIATDRLPVYTDDAIWAEDLKRHYDLSRRIPEARYSTSLGKDFRQADVILAAFPQIAPPSGNEAVEAARRIVSREWETMKERHIISLAETMARYILSLAPGKDVVEGAEEIAGLVHDDIKDAPTMPEAIEAAKHHIAAFATACVARERARWIKSPEESQRMLAADALRARRTP